MQLTTDRAPANTAHLTDHCHDARRCAFDAAQRQPSEGNRQATKNRSAEGLSRGEQGAENASLQGMAGLVRSLDVPAPEFDVCPPLEPCATSEPLRCLP